MGVLYIADRDHQWFVDRQDYRGAFTDSISLGLELPRLDVCLIVPFGREVAGLCLISRGDAVVTLRRRVRFSDLFILDQPLPLEEITRAMPSQLRRHLLARLLTGGVVPPRTWESLVAAVKELRPEAAAAMASLEVLAREPSAVFTGRGSENLTLERDAVGLALLAAGIDRSDLYTWREPDEPAPFLRGLWRYPPIEDRLVDYDASVFGDWQLTHRDTSGVAVFEDGPNKLTVLNVNRTNIEQALGVDLVYYNHRFRSFVLVQYKRMRKESGRDVYRPDKRLSGELLRMRRIPISQDPSEDPSDFRLNAGSCYLKLCPDVPFRLREGGLIRGMYLPLAYFDELLEAEASVGSGGGVRVTFDTAERHITSSLFADLIRDGWIGSRTASSELLEHVVEELLQQRHSVTLADYRRTDGT